MLQTIARLIQSIFAHILHQLSAYKVFGVDAILPAVIITAIFGLVPGVAALLLVPLAYHAGAAVVTFYVSDGLITHYERQVEAANRLAAAANGCDCPDCARARESTADDDLVESIMRAVREMEGQ